jgi:hypothetical protein
MKKLYFLFLLLIAGTVSYGQILLSDNFNYADDSELINNGWTLTGSASTNRLKVGTSDGLTYSGYLTTVVAGNSANLLAGAIGDDAHRTFDAQSSGSVYASFLVNVSTATTSGDYVIHFGPSPIGTTFRARFFIKRDASNNVAFGVSNASTSTITYSNFDYALNTTYLVVLKLEIVEGTNNDVSSIIINPAIALSEPSTGWLVATDAITSEVSIASLGIRQGGSTSTPAVKIDGLRVTNVWPFSLSDATLDVVKNDISNFSLYPNPVKGGKVFINSANTYAERSVAVFDVLGKQVVSQKGTQNNIDVSHLNKGVYIMKVEEEGKVATRKLVIE